jgi:hypothetical protein
LTRRVFLAIAAIALVLVPVAIVVAGWRVVITNLGAAFLVMLLVLVVVELLATRRPPASQAGQGLPVNRALFRTALAVSTLLANVVTITGVSVTALAADLQGHDPAAPPATSAPPTTLPEPAGATSVRPTTVEQPAPVRFESPRRLKQGRPRAKRFLNVRGSGTVPEGTHLWVFVYTADEKFYYPAGEASIGPDFWYANGITLGGDARQYPEDVDALYTIYAVLLEDGASRELAERMREHNDIVQLTKPPAHAETADFVTVLRTE